MLVAGGNGALQPDAELYDPDTGNWTVTGNLNTTRSNHTATLLPSGEVLVAGGFGVEYLKSAELYDPGIVTATTVDGRGTLDNEGNEVTFQFRATQAADSNKLGNFFFCDPAAGVCITRAGIRTLAITWNSAELSGQTKLEDGTKVIFTVTVTDNGKPGTSDSFSISLSNGYSLTGPPTSGDIRIY